AMPVIGFLSSRMASESVSVVTAFHQGLKEIGYVEGQNVSIEYRWADFQDDRLPAMAADLVQRRVAVIAATGSTVAASAAKLATTTIPIVFSAGSDPVKEGLVANLNRPGGNITGMTPFTQQLGAKQLELLHSMVPTAAVVAVLGKRNDPDTETQLKDVETAARTLGLQILALTLYSQTDFQTAFATLVPKGRWPAPHFQRGLLHSESRATCHLCRPSRNSRYLHAARVPAGRWPDELRTQTYRLNITKWASTSARFSRALNLPTCRYCSRRNSNLSSISE